MIKHGNFFATYKAAVPTIVIPPTAQISYTRKPLLTESNISHESTITGALSNKKILPQTATTESVVDLVNTFIHQSLKTIHTATLISTTKKLEQSEISHPIPNEIEIPSQQLFAPEEKIWRKIHHDGSCILQNGVICEFGCVSQKK